MSYLHVCFRANRAVCTAPKMWTGSLRRAHTHIHTPPHTPITFPLAPSGQAQSLTSPCHSIHQAIFAFVIINIKYVQRQIFGFGDLEVVNELMYSHEESRGVRVFSHTHVLSASPALYRKGLSVVTQGKTHNSWGIAWKKSHGPWLKFRGRPVVKFYFRSLLLWYNVTTCIACKQ